MDFKNCSRCKEYLFEEDMFRKLKNGKYSKRCFNCSGRTDKEFIESMSKIFNPNELNEIFNNNFVSVK